MIKFVTSVLFIVLSGQLSCLFSQIEVDSTLLIGDTTQLVLLQTEKGDQLVGSVTHWTQDSLKFLLNVGSALRFQLSEVKSIDVLEAKRKSVAVDYSKGEFTFISGNNQFRRGQLLIYTRQGVRIRYNRKRHAYIRNSNLLEVTFSEKGLYGEYPNRFRLSLKEGKPIVGRLIGMGPDFIDFQAIGQAPVRYPRSSVTSIFPKKIRRPIIGHQRSLLIAPTGFNLRRGEVEYRNVDYILNNTYSKGLTDNLSVTAGLFGLEPYVQFKVSKDFGKYFHASMGGGVTVSGAVGGHASLSLGTPDYFLNMGYIKGVGDFIFGDTDMDAIHVGGSFRIADRHRLIGEAIHVVERRTLLDFNQYGTNGFGVAYAWFARRVSLTMGLMFAEKTETDICIIPPFTVIECNTENYAYNVFPIISTSIFFGEMYRN
ncbi:MAG: hypothetical protein AAFZ15_00790 [Bacteroidota bacterium]